MKLIPLLLLLSGSRLINAQIDSSFSSFRVSGYAELYYAYDFSQPEDHNRPAFIYSHNRHNEVNLNLGFLKATYIAENVRANLAMATGTYMNANYATEPGVLKNIYEAYAGVKLFRKSNFWLDAGIFPSHIGFETAVSKDCWGLTRSIASENSPYYEAGAKLTYVSADGKWLLSGLVLNGWQHIQRPEGNNSPAFGTQITFSPSKTVTINYSTFIGSDKPDTSRQMRYFHNFYSMIHFTDHFHVTAGLDYGIEQESEGSTSYNQWYTPLLLLMVVFNDKWSITGRGEYYSDVNEVIISTSAGNGFQTAGFSINLDYRIRENAIWRIEGRMFKSKENIFSKAGSAVNTNTCITTSLAVSF